MLPHLTHMTTFSQLTWTSMVDSSTESPTFSAMSWPPNLVQRHQCSSHICVNNPISQKTQLPFMIKLWPTHLSNNIKKHLPPVHKVRYPNTTPNTWWCHDDAATSTHDFIYKSPQYKIQKEYQQKTLLAHVAKILKNSKKLFKKWTIQKAKTFRRSFPSPRNTAQYHSDQQWLKTCKGSCMRFWPSTSLCWKDKWSTKKTTKALRGPGTEDPSQDNHTITSNIGNPMFPVLSLHSIIHENSSSSSF